jgi:hypothetical protein
VKQIDLVFHTSIFVAGRRTNDSQKTKTAERGRFTQTNNLQQHNQLSAFILLYVPSGNTPHSVNTPSACHDFLGAAKDFREKILKNFLKKAVFFRKSRVFQKRRFLEKF